MIPHSCVSRALPPAKRILSSWQFYANLRVGSDPEAGVVASGPAPVDDETWDAVRAKWPILAGRSNDELVVALAPIKAKKVDYRSLEKPKGEGGFKFPWQS